MFVTDQDLDSLVGNGPAFEAMLHDLIRAEAVVCRVPQDQIEWDYRTTVPDGGRDIRIRVGSLASDRSWLPEAPSVWSAKAGQDGLQPSKLQSEVLDHPKVLAHLKSGGTYCWCPLAAASNNDVRDRLRDKSEKLAKANGFKSDQIAFYFRDKLTAWLKVHLGLIPVHLPHLPRGWQTLDDWRALDRDFRTSWIPFGARDDLRLRIQQHLLGSDEPNVLHLTGRSGIGKTRTALEACADHHALAETMYFQGPDDFTSGAEQYLTRNRQARAAVVIDEVPLDEWDRLTSRLAGYADRIRVLTIGSAPEGSTTSRLGILEAPPPTVDDGVVQVVRARDPGLKSAEARHLAEFSERDLRLALCLVAANREDPGLAKLPVVPVDLVFRRILDQYTGELGDSVQFQQRYALLSLCIDIGNVGEVRQELQYLARYLGVADAEVDRAVGIAIRCGLGTQQGRFFEAGPRALARRAFERWGWPLVKNNADAFVAEMPSTRMQRRFHERGQECATAIREEVSAALAAWFRGRFPSPDIRLVQDRDASRVFATFTELDPARGLRWLRSAVESASASDLRSLDGDPDGSGGWRGRRQVVWVCEHLSTFPEYFYECEAILYRLCQHETEQRIGNNSTEEWKGLFLPVLSRTAIPFPERFELLMLHLRNAEPTSVSIVIDAVIGVLQPRMARTAAPRVVGGRLVPEEWRPHTVGDLQSLRVSSARRFIELVQGLSAEVQTIARSVVVENVDTFLDLGVVESLERWLEPKTLDDDTLRRLRAGLDQYVGRVAAVREREPDVFDDSNPGLTEIRKWRRAVEPLVLSDRIRDVTGRDYWTWGRSGNVERARNVYAELASGILDSPGVLLDLWDWLGSDKARSAEALGWALGDRDTQGAITDQIMERIREGKAQDLLSGYLSAIAARSSALPKEITAELDRAAVLHPRFVCAVSIRADQSRAGLTRVLQTAARVGQGASALLMGLAWQPWSDLLAPVDKARVIELMGQLSSRGDQWSLKNALDLLSTWVHGENGALPEEMSPAVLLVAERCLVGDLPFDPSDWAHILTRVSDKHVGKKVALLVLGIVPERTRIHGLDEAASEVLKSLAPRYGRQVLDSIGKFMLGKKSPPWPILRPLRGLFEGVGAEVVADWIGRAGRNGAILVAPHVLSPAPTPEDPSYVPPLTRWILNEFASDDEVFRAFLSGRHSFEVFWGRAKNRYGGVSTQLSAYLRHPMRRVREWARYEIDNARQMIEWDEQEEAEFGRE